MSSATGLHFRVAARNANIHISWAPALLAPAHADADKAGITSVKLQPQLTGISMSSATIQISSRLTGHNPQNSELPVLLHELGHAVGLGHYPGPQVMNPVDQGYSAYQAGDLAGLAVLYNQANCH
jgi:predicted Zn-dependent protease